MGVAGGPAVGEDLLQFRGAGGEGGDGFVQVAVGGGDADAVVAGEAVEGGVANQRSTSSACR